MSSILVRRELSYILVRSSGSIMDRGKNPLSRMKYNYEMWHISEGKGVVSSLLLTGVNTVFGMTKKIRYKGKLK